MVMISMKFLKLYQDFKKNELAEKSKILNEQIEETQFLRTDKRVYSIGNASMRMMEWMIIDRF